MIKVVRTIKLEKNIEEEERKACAISSRRHYLFPGSFLKEPPYLLLLPRISVISGMKLANMA